MPSHTLLLVLTLATAPPEGTPPAASAADRALIARSQLTIVYYDPVKDPQSYVGFTDFDLTSKWKFSLEWNPKRHRPGQPLEVTVKVVDQQPQQTVSLRLPERYRNRDPFWEDPLVQHELDHVRIVCDPRPLLLLEHLGKSLHRVRVTAGKTPRETHELATAAVNAELSAQVTAVTELLKHANQQLDDLTQHGTQQTPEREALLAGLFLKAYLAEAQFPYLGQVLPVLERHNYRPAP